MFTRHIRIISTHTHLKVLSLVFLNTCLPPPVQCSQIDYNFLLAVMDIWRIVFANICLDKSPPALPSVRNATSPSFRRMQSHPFLPSEMHDFLPFGECSPCFYCLEYNPSFQPVNATTLLFHQECISSPLQGMQPLFLPSKIQSSFLTANATPSLPSGMHPLLPSGECSHSL